MMENVCCSMIKDFQHILTAAEINSTDVDFTLLTDKINSLKRSVKDLGITVSQELEESEAHTNAALDQISNQSDKISKNLDKMSDQIRALSEYIVSSIHSYSRKIIWFKIMMKLIIILRHL